MASEIPESKLRIACVQMEPRVGEKDRNVARGLELISRAAEGGANLVVDAFQENVAKAFAERSVVRLLIVGEEHAGDQVVLEKLLACGLVPDGGQERAVKVANSGLLTAVDVLCSRDVDRLEAEQCARQDVRECSNIRTDDRRDLWIATDRLTVQQSYDEEALVQHLDASKCHAL